jgi:hypothetical protein
MLCLGTGILRYTGAALALLSLAAGVRLWRIAAGPYLHLTDAQVTVYRGLLVSPVHHSLVGIGGAHTNRPETYIELIGKDTQSTVRIDLHPLAKADRIRFIFLVESNINRKFSHRHSPPRESAG